MRTTNNGKRSEALKEKKAVLETVKEVHIHTHTYIHTYIHATDMHALIHAYHTQSQAQGSSKGH